MKNSIYILIAAFFIPSGVFAWSTPGQNFSDEINFGGPVTNSRNPWVWKLGEGNDHLNSKLSSDVVKKGRVSDLIINIPAMNILLGKTNLISPVGKEGITPRITFGANASGFSIDWLNNGIASVTLPVYINNLNKGFFSFQMKVGSVLCHALDSRRICYGLYDNIKSNGLPPQSYEMNPEQTGSTLLSMFSGDAPHWLPVTKIQGTTGLARFKDTHLRQIEGLYGAQAIAGTGKLQIDGELPVKWKVSLPISIEYQ